MSHVPKDTPHPYLPRKNGTWTRRVGPNGIVSRSIIVGNGPNKGALYEFVSARLDGRHGHILAEYRVVGFNPVGKIEGKVHARFNTRA